jgi:uncharacterized protein YoxC
MKKTKVISLVLAIVLGCSWMAGAENSDPSPTEKDDAITALRKYFGGGVEADFTEPDKEGLTKAREKGENAIKKAKDGASVESALSDAKKEINDIYGKILDVKRKEARDELDGYFGSQREARHFTGNQWRNLVAVKEEGRKKIEAATTVTDVSGALDYAKTAIDGLPADEDMALAAEAALDVAKNQLERVEEKMQKKYEWLYTIGMDAREAAENALSNKDWAVVTANVEKINAVVVTIRILTANEKNFLSLLIILIAAGGITLISLVIAILSFIKSATGTKRIQAAQETLEGITSNMNALSVLYREQGKTLSYIETLPEQIKKVEEKIDRVERVVWGIDPCIRDINVHLKNIEISPESFFPLTEKRPSSTGDPVSDFNVWASNPVSRLPGNFYYLENDMRIRKSQPLTTSTTETKWISNKDAGKKYLFPNPNFFDQMTDISELYTMDLTKLRPRGQNRIIITKPCEMSDSGYINYQGELTLL